jgi:hypothetical protein
MSLFNEEPWHLAFRWKGRRYRRSCKTSRQPEAKKVKALVLAAVTGRRSVALPGGWQLLESTSIAGMKLDHIRADNALTIEESSAAKTNNARRTLRDPC